MDTPEDRALLEKTFPQLAATGYEIKSCRTADYNCFAYAADDEHIKWDPFNRPYTYWPTRVPGDRRLTSLIAAYRTIGYEVCEDGSVEDGLEKIAIYGSIDDKFTHAAIQRASGRWASKLGVLHDIEHNSLDGVLCDAYGSVKRFMSRSKREADKDERRASQHPQHEANITGPPDA
jgi:hypothetical protein